MAIVEKKIWPENFEEVSSGKKKYEPRLLDFKINEGDELLLKEWNPKEGKYTGRKIKKKVIKVLKLLPSEIRKYWTQDEIEEKGIQVIEFE